MQWPLLLSLLRHAKAYEVVIALAKMCYLFNPADSDTMKLSPLLSPLLSLLLPPAALILAVAPVCAQDHTPGASITNATWAQHSSMYRHSPLCSEEEITLWSCENSKRVYSLCSSRAVTRTSGYMQYRASLGGKIEFTYPAGKKPPLGSFVYHSHANGDASIEFTSGGYGYALVDPLRDNSSIIVSAPAPSRKQTEIKCGGNQTLQVNYTMRLMYDAGVWTGN